MFSKLILFFGLYKSAVILRARDKVGPGPSLQLMPLMNGIGRAAHAGHRLGTAPDGPHAGLMRRGVPTCAPMRVNRARLCAPPVPGTPSTTSCRAPASRQPGSTRQPCAALQAVSANAVASQEQRGAALDRGPVPWVATTGTLASTRGF